MAAKGQSFAEKISRWTVMVTNARENLADVPHLADDLAEMDRLILEGRTLESRQDDLRSQFQENTKKIRALTSTADKLRSRLAAGLQSKYGFTSETLVKFGVKPRRIPRRRAAEKPPTPPEEPAAAAK